MEKRRKNAEILDRSIAFFYDMIYQINMAIQEQDLNRKSFKFENHFYNRRKHIMKTTVHIISHSHWDREWYQSFEKHRMKLIELVDNILEKAENDPEFGGFFLDGQTIALDDYLEVRPEKREQVEKCVREGKIQTGPWYILQDEFLTSGEACVRNLQVGMQEAARYGAIGNVGYFPDAFGNAGQMPQVLKQAGMDAVVFGRGVKPIGPNNEVTGGQYESTYSEMMWASPDGTKLPGILFANWYNNGVEIPVDEALRWGRSNNPQLLELKQNVLEAERNVDRTKKESRFNASVNASIGFNQVAENFGDVYHKPMQQDLVAVSVSIPLLDWGVRKGKYNMARNNLNVVKISARQDEISIEEEVIMTVSDFNIQQQLIASAEEALDLAILAYNETRQRFIIGKADINSLTLSLNRQQEAQRNYISALQNYWLNYYKIRRLTLFDFATKLSLSDRFDFNGGRLIR